MSGGNTPSVTIAPPADIVLTTLTAASAEKRTKARVGGYSCFDCLVCATPTSGCVPR